MAFIKKPYEISLWEDILTFVVKDSSGKIIEYESSIPEGATGSVIAQYYKERKICIIGSDTMDTPIRATSAKLNPKINGESTLTFNMYSHYYDEQLDDFFENPFIGLLVNERKIKLRYGALGEEDTKWYDLIIKNIQENSETKTFSYTAKSLFINELSKTGFDLEFKTELENNIGNINTLAQAVLVESDWQFKDSGMVLKQTVEEPLYELTLKSTITATDMEKEENKITLNSGTIIYAFYNSIVNQSSVLQFLYVNPIEVNDDYVITNSPNWYITGIEYDQNNGLPNIARSMAISDNYRGNRLVIKTKTIYDATIDKYVNVYWDGSKEVYGYTETEYVSPATVRSYVTNPSNYDSQVGWEIGGSKVSEEDSVVFPELSVVSVPDVRDAGADYDDFSSCLKLTTTNITQTNWSSGQIIYNSGIVDNRKNLNGFTVGDKYVFRVKYGKGVINDKDRATSITGTSTDLKMVVAKYELTDGAYIIKPEDVYFECVIKSNDTNQKPQYLYEIVSCNKTLTYDEMVQMSNSLGLFLQPQSIGTIYIEDVQFFNYISKDGSGAPLLPNEVAEGETKTKYYYYIPSDDYKSIDDVVYVYQDYEPAGYDEVYHNGEAAYEKIRSITASESNRFNLIQELCEIFECWPDFEIEHNIDGSVKLDENYRPLKWVSFHEYIGKDNYSGFKYGVNLKSIQRTVDSEAIVSKMVVKNNSNEFAKDGFCSIARANENPCGDNFLLDFSYYIQQGMIGLAELTNDLYVEANGYLGYYKKLREINDKRDSYIEEQSGLLTTIPKYESSYQTYTLSVRQSEEQLKDKIILVKTLTGYTYEELLANQDPETDNADIASWWDNEEVNMTMSSIARLKNIIKNHKVLAENSKKNLDTAQARYDQLKRILTSRKEPSQDQEGEERLLLQKEAINKQFYKKYSRFLQEGPWISEDYIDDDLYYLDAQSTLHTSSQPKVTYNIEVLELSQLEGYENFVFALGDKTTIEDTEFFGWTYINGVQTPYKEEIVVTELTIFLDSPEQNKIKVQNYKTQFEDLFQRMAATTQAVEYSTGKYSKVSNIIEEDGTIKITTLQNAIANNALILENAKDQSVIWDSSGITTTSLSNPNEMLRIVSGGLFISTDGGITWNTGITGSGINANYITGGQLDVEAVHILNGSFPSFRWDSLGISAYRFSIDENTGEPHLFKDSEFIRLDQFGLYGIKGFSGFNPLTPDEENRTGEDKIWAHSNFALTWKGFQIKSSHTVGGYVSITSDNDIQVINSEGKDQIKIGLLYEDLKVYGIRINNADGEAVMEHSSDGQLWISGQLNVGNKNSPTVKIGALEGLKKQEYINFVDFEGKEIHEVINANNKFMVYEDGSMKATDGEFTGIIHATGGTIGGLEIEQVKGVGYEAQIVCEQGTVFKNGKGEKILEAYLYKGKDQVTEGLTYQWYRFGEEIEGEVGQTLKVTAEDLNPGSQNTEFACVITYNASN